MPGVSEEKGLGVIITSTLSWDSHILTITGKANKLLGLLKRTCPLLTDISVRRSLYLSLVKSQLCYATQVWSPAYVSQNATVEQVQRPISSPEPTLPLSSGTGNGRSGRIQNRNQKILVPVWLRLREVSGQNGGCWSCQHVQQDQFRAVSRGDSTVIDQQSENSHIHAVEANLWAISFV